MAEAHGLVVGLVGVELAADSFLKYAATHNGKELLGIFGFLGYGIIAGIIFAINDPSRALQWGIANTSWNAFNTIITAAVFTLFFHESYTAMQWIGIVLVSLGLYMVSMG